MTLDGIELSDDLQWVDELLPWSILQSERATLAGTQVIERGELQSGRPITLQSQADGSKYGGVATRAVVRQLLDLHAAASPTPMVLVVPDEVTGTRTFNVHWRHADGAPIEVEPLVHRVPPDPADLYTLTLRLMTA